MKRKIITILTVLTVIVSIITGILYFKRQHETPGDLTIEENQIQEQHSSMELNTKLTKIYGEYSFHYLIDAVDQYYKFLQEKDENKIKNVIESKYIESFKFEIENLEDYYIDIIDVYMNEQTYDLSTHVVDVDIINNKTNEIKEDKVIIRLDLENMTYSAIPYKYVENKNEIVEGKEFVISYKSITANKDNTLDMNNWLDKYNLAKYYYNRIKYLSLNDIDKAYSLLDDKYKEENCETIEKFKTIIEKRFDKDTKITHQKRAINSNGDIAIQCKDSKNNEYIIVVGQAENGLFDFRYTIK